MHELPEDFPKWKKRAEWISRNYQAPGKEAAEAVKKILQFFNGDTSCSTMVHWCTGCCESDEQARSKALRLLAPLLGKGYPIPFLSRFKHFGPAISYIKFTCTLHRILPKILNGMKEGSKPSSELASMVDSLLSDSSIAPTKAGHITEEEMQTLIGGILDADLSYSLQNSVRKNMIFKAVSHQDFDHHAIIMACLLEPIDIAINELFSRTKILHQIGNIGWVDPQYDELVQKSRAKFFRVVRGDLGRDLMVRYQSILVKELAESIDMGMDIESRPDLLQLAFTLVLVGISDCWRRLVHEFSRPPFSVFSLANSSTAAFIEQWRILHEVRANCSSCVDDTFTEVLLSQLSMSELLSASPAQQESAISIIKQVLLDLAGTIPLSSDLVEIKNGVVQWAVSRRGKQQIKNPTTARETSILQACIKQFDFVKPMADADTMPSRKTSSSILKMSGIQSTNQYSKDFGKQEPGLF